MTPHLENKEKFVEILKNYQMSDEAKQLVDSLNLLLLISPTSAGRNTMIKKLVESGKYHYIVSDTTRPMRENNGVMEQDGVEYHFKSEDEFLAGLEAGDYVEAAIVHNQQVSGISLAEVKKAAEDDKIAVDELEIVGADTFAHAKPDSNIVFILPPSFDEWMKRMQARNDMTTEEIHNRLESAEIELQTAIDKEYFKFVVNDDLELAVARLREIVETGKYDQSDRQASVELAWQLLSEVKRELHS